MSRRLLTFLAAALALPASAAAEQRLVTIETPSKHVDEKTAVFNGERPEVLKANVLLPNGYDEDPEQRWRVLYLLHGVGDTYATWAKPANGDILETAKGLPAIVVMPEAGKGFYTDWFNGGKRGDPAWESFYLRELIPQIHRRFRVARGRGHHAIAGLSMGGLGAAYLGAQRPDYFGAVATFSGFVQHQRPTVKAGLGAVGGVEYEDIFGPLYGPYATGHNPTRIAANLRHTPVFAATGNGTPQPGVQSSPGATVGGGAVEAEIFQQNEEFAAALRDAGVELTYRPQLGVHDWPYWRQYLRDAIEWGLFRAVEERPTTWSYSTVAGRGRMWTLRYRFDAPPEAVATFERDGNVLRGSGEGRVLITDVRSGCGYRVTLPFEHSLPVRTATCGRVKLKVAPRVVRRGRAERVRVRVTRVVLDGRAFPVRGATVRIGRARAVTGRAGRATLRVRVARRGARPLVRVVVPRFREFRTRLRVR